jgi:hypothetical protein
MYALAPAQIVSAGTVPYLYRYGPSERCELKNDKKVFLFNFEHVNTTVRLLEWERHAGLTLGDDSVY